jgi:hypothetical protein
VDQTTSTASFTKGPLSLGGVADGKFPLTQWSVISLAQKCGDSELVAALDRLVRIYWRPLYAFALGKRLDHHAAEDAVQGFFGHVCSRQVLDRVERRETKFRTFLLSAFSNWLTDEWRRSLAAKRGGDVEHEPLSSSLDVTSEVDPITEFDRCWARTLFDRARERLRDEVAQGQQAELSGEIVGRLFSPAPDWESLAAAAGQSHESIRQRAMRLRQRFSAMLREEVWAVVSTEAELGDELRYMLACLSSEA